MAGAERLGQLSANAWRRGDLNPRFFQGMRRHWCDTWDGMVVMGVVLVSDTDARVRVGAAGTSERELVHFSCALLSGGRSSLIRETKLTADLVDLHDGYILITITPRILVELLMNYILASNRRSSQLVQVPKRNRDYVYAPSQSKRSGTVNSGTGKPNGPLRLQYGKSGDLTLTSE